MDHLARSGICPQKGGRDRLIRLAVTHPDRVLGFADAVWWSRAAQPHMASWADAGAPLRLVAQTVARADPGPKALACYGLLVRQWVADGTRGEQMLPRFVDGRPVSAIATQFLGRCCARLAEAGRMAPLLVWDNAGWHISKTVRAWIRAHNRAVKRGGGGGADRRLLLADEESVAQPDRAEMDAWQAMDRRTGTIVDGGGDRHTGLRLFRLRPRASPIRERRGLLIEH